MRIWCEFDCYCKFDEREENSIISKMRILLHRILILWLQKCVISNYLYWDVPGVVIIGNTLEGRAGEREYWYTPFHFVFGIGILARKRRQEEAKKAIVIDKEEVAESDTDGLLRAVGII